MFKRKLTAALLAFFVSFAPARALSTDLDANLVGVSGTTVTVAVHNPTSSTQTIRVSVKVKYADRTTQTLVSVNVTLNSGETVTVTIQGSKPIAKVIDDPEPINPL